MEPELATGTVRDPADRGLALHERRLSGDRSADSAIAFEYFEIVARRLRAMVRGVHDDHLVYDAVVTAFTGYFDHPERYDATKRSLIGYLLMSAQGDLLNLLKSEDKRASRERSYDGFVENGEGETEYEIQFAADDDVEEEVLLALSEVPGILDTLFPEPTDRRMIDLMLDGVRETSEYTALLQLADRPAPEQAAEVKRNKDRLKKKLQRWYQSPRGGLHDD